LSPSFVTRTFVCGSAATAPAGYALWRSKILKGIEAALGCI